MTYHIYYMPSENTETGNEYCLFDIEYYLDRDKLKSDRWYTKIICWPLIRGLAFFFKEKFNDKDFDMESFVLDADFLQDLRKLFSARIDNRPRKITEARQYHYNVLEKDLRKILEDFCNKYNLTFEIH